MMFPDIIPLSLPAIINRVRTRYPVRGLFYWEVDDAIIKQAEIVILDIHWYTMLKTGIALSHRLKAINPRVVLIAGGLSASMFYKQVLRDSALDYIIRGDGDRPLLDLVTALVENKPIGAVPNVVCRDVESQHWYSLTQEDLDNGDYRDISWFPTLQQRIKRYHRVSAERPIPVHPVVTTFRGCPMPCDECLGGLTHQQTVFGRPYMLRNHDKVKEDLQAYGADPDTSFVYLYHDFMGLADQAYINTVCDGTYNVRVFYEFFSPPSEDKVALLLNTFSGGVIFFPLDTMHSTSTTVGNVDNLIGAIRQVQGDPRFDLRLSYIKWGVTHAPSYATAFNRVLKETGCRVYQSDWWWEKRNPLPDASGAVDELLYQTCLANTNRFRAFNTLFNLSVQAYALNPGLYLFCTAIYEKSKYYLPLNRI